MITKKITLLHQGSYNSDQHRSYQCVYYFFGIPFWKVTVLAWKTEFCSKDY